MELSEFQQRRRKKYKTMRWYEKRGRTAAKNISEESQNPGISTRRCKEATHNSNQREMRKRVGNRRRSVMKGVKAERAGEKRGREIEKSPKKGKI